MKMFTPPPLPFKILKLLFLGILIIVMGCEQNTLEKPTSQQEDFDLAIKTYQQKMENVHNIADDKVLPYLIKTSKPLIQDSDLSQEEKDNYLSHPTNTVINKAAAIYFKATGKGQTKTIGAKVKPKNSQPTTLNNNYQPKFTVINMSPCQVDYTLFIKKSIGGCSTTNPTYYTIDDLLHVPANTTLDYNNGFSSFGSHIWEPNSETTQQLVNQDLNAYYFSAKYLVGTNCANTSIGFCGAAQGSSHIQMCNGCDGNGVNYTAALYPAIGSNPDSPSQPSDQDMTLFIKQTP